jgi:hypothetical protein
MLQPGTIPAAGEDGMRSDTGREAATAVPPPNHTLSEPPAVARGAGIRYPVALTAAAWERCVALPPSVFCQEEDGRL